MNTKKTILLVLWFAGSSMMLPAQWLNHDFRLTNEDEFSRPLFRSKPKPVRGQPLLLPEKGYIYSYYMDLRSHELSYFYDEEGILKTELRISLIPDDFATVKIDYNQTLTIDGLDMPDTATYYYDTDMTRPVRRKYWNWRLFDVAPIDSFYFEEIYQNWDTPNKRWVNHYKDYYGFIDTVMWELNRDRRYGGDGDGWSIARDWTDSLLYDDRGFVAGMIKGMDEDRVKRIYDLNEDGSVRIDSFYYYNSEGQPDLLRRIDEYEWQEWNGYGDMNLTFVIGGDGLFSFFPWMKFRNKRTTWDSYYINNEGEKEFSFKKKKYWNTGPYDSNIDSVFISPDGSPENLYLYYIEENLYDSYGNYIKYSNTGYDPPDETGHQTMNPPAVYEYYYHYIDYGEHGIGCDTMMFWLSNWDEPSGTYEMKLQTAIIITQFVGFTGIVEINDGPKTLSIFPNPVSGIVTITASSAIQQLSIYDITGRLVASPSPAGERVVFDTGALPQGIYIVRALLKDGGVRTGKVVVR